MINLTTHYTKGKTMKTKYTLSVLMLAAATALGGCASYDGFQSSNASQASYNTYGSIESIQAVRGGKNTSGAGAVVGGLAGALLGNQIGSGSGRAVATAAGAVGGAVVGNNVEQNRNAQGADRYEIRVRLDNGGHTTIVQDSIDNLRNGDRVRLVDGRAYRY